MQEMLANTMKNMEAMLDAKLWQLQVNLEDGLQQLRDGFTNGQEAHGERIEYLEKALGDSAHT